MGTILTSKPSKFFKEINAFKKKQPHTSTSTTHSRPACIVVYASKCRNSRKQLSQKNTPVLASSCDRGEPRQSSCWCVGRQIPSLHWYLPPTHPPTVRCWCLHPLAQPGAPSHHTTPKSPTGGQSPSRLSCAQCCSWGTLVSRAFPAWTSTWACGGLLARAGASPCWICMWYL